MNNTLLDTEIIYDLESVLTYYVQGSMITVTSM